MKTLTCNICGTHAVKGESEQEVMDGMWAHVGSDHAEDAAKMEGMPEEEKNKMMDSVKAMIKDEE